MISHNCQQPILKRRRWFLLAASAACLLLFVVLFSIVLATNSRAETKFLKTIFGETASELEVIGSGQETGVLFGDSQYAYHVRSKGVTKLPEEARIADANDLEFATRCIEQLLGESLGGLQAAAVYRMRRGRHSVYFVQDRQANDVYVYVIIN